jgi:hypothetical protein
MVSMLHSCYDRVTATSLDSMSRRSTVVCARKTGSSGFRTNIKASQDLEVRCEDNAADLECVREHCALHFVKNPDRIPFDSFNAIFRFFLRIGFMV